MHERSVTEKAREAYIPNKSKQVQTRPNKAKQVQTSPKGQKGKSAPNSVTSHTMTLRAAPRPASVCHPVAEITTSTPEIYGRDRATSTPEMTISTPEIATSTTEIHRVRTLRGRRDCNPSAQRAAAAAAPAPATAPATAPAAPAGSAAAAAAGSAPQSA